MLQAQLKPKGASCKSIFIYIQQKLLKCSLGFLCEFNLEVLALRALFSPDHVRLPLNVNFNPMNKIYVE